MKGKTMMQYLFDIKTKCAAIATSRYPLSTKDMNIYTIDRLPSTY